MRIIKSILAIMCLVCLLDMPYGYYELFSYVGSGLLIYFAIKEGNNFFWSFLWVALVIIIQPFFELGLEIELWNRVYVIISIILLLSIFNILRIRNISDYINWMFLTDYLKNNYHKINWQRNLFPELLNYLILVLHMFLVGIPFTMFTDIEFNFIYFLAMSIIFLCIIMNTYIRSRINRLNETILKVAKYINIGNPKFEQVYFSFFLLTQGRFVINNPIVLEYRENLKGDSSLSDNLTAYYAQDYELGKSFSKWYEKHKLNKEMAKTNDSDNKFIEVIGDYEFNTIKAFYFKNIFNKKKVPTKVIDLFSEKVKTLNFSDVFN
jgi:hypothetical protein